jgi:hypothetical protein
MYHIFEKQIQTKITTDDVKKLSNFFQVFNLPVGDTF